MRRRRFKKASAASATSTTTTETTQTTSTASKDVTDSTPLVETNPVTKDSSNSKPPVNETTSTSSPSNESESTTNPQKKKYIGVAKMRRKMLKQQKQDQQTKQTSSIPTNTIPSTPTTSDITTQLLKQQIRTTLFLRILLLITLFSSGFYIGYYNSRKSPPLHVDHDLALIHRSHIINAIRGTGSKNPISALASMDVEELDSKIHKEFQDEFSEWTESTKPNPNENIDPIFRINLDLYTQGDGIIFALARYAIQFHRFWTGLFLLRGTTFVPPLFVILCLLLRLSNHFLLPILGVSQPFTELLELETQTKKRLEESENQNQTLNLDIVEMVSSTLKRMVSGFVPEYFWMIWNTWWNVRKDLYVLLCGLLWGLTLPTLMSSMTSGDMEGGLGDGEL